MVIRILFRRNPVAYKAVLAWATNTQNTFRQSQLVTDEVQTTANLCAAADSYDLLLVHESFCNGTVDITGRAPLAWSPLWCSPPTTPLLYNLAAPGAGACFRHLRTCMPPRSRQEYMRATLITSSGAKVRVASGRLPAGRPVAEQLALLRVADADVVAVTPSCSADALDLCTQMNAAGFHLAATYADAADTADGWCAAPNDNGLWVRWTLADSVRFERCADGVERLLIDDSSIVSLPSPSPVCNGVAETSV